MISYLFFLIPLMRKQKVQLSVPALARSVMRSFPLENSCLCKRTVRLASPSVCLCNKCYAYLCINILQQDNYLDLC